MKAVGILEAKRKEIDASSPKVCEQTAMYARGVPNCYQVWSKPLPFGYQSNGESIFFQDFRNPGNGLNSVHRIHTPKEMAKMLDITDPYAGLPALSKHEKNALRACQIEAITELEKSLRAGQNKSLMVLFVISEILSSGVLPSIHSQSESWQLWQRIVLAASRAALSNTHVPCPRAS